LWFLILLGVLALEALSEGDVVSLGLFGGGALEGAPCVPLGLALHVEHAWAVCRTKKVKEKRKEDFK